MYRMEDESSLIYSSSDIDNYVMYKLSPKNKNLKYCYIGHTNNFVFRKRQHYLPCVDLNHSKSHILSYTKPFVTMVDGMNGKWLNLKILTERQN